MEEIPGMKKWLRDHFGLEILTAQTRGHQGDGKRPERNGGEIGSETA
jgi:hypothetical protein